jgi:hypothetical protein
VAKIVTWIAIAAMLAQTLFMNTPAYAATRIAEPLVSTEAFQTIDAADEAATTLDLRFGDTLGQRLYYDKTNLRFQLTRSLAVAGDITATGSIIAAGTLSGKSLVISGGASISGATLFRTTVTTKGSFSGASFYGSGLGDCANTTTSKVVYDPATGKFICATDQTGGGGGLEFSTASGVFVNQGGDTMTGQLSIRPTAGNAVMGLNVAATMSGNALRISGNATVHGSLTSSGAIRTDSGVTLNDANAATDAIFTFGNSVAVQTVKFVHSSQLFQFSKGINVLGTISGSNLVVSGVASFSGATTFKKTVGVQGTLSGNILHIEKNAGFSGALVIDMKDTTTGTGLYLQEKAYLGSGAVLSGALMLKSSYVPPKAAAGFVKTYAQTLGGREMLGGRDSNGFASPYQPALFNNLIMMLTTGGSTTVNGYGTTVTNDTTVSHPAATETFGYMTNFATAATAGDTAGTSSVNTTFFRGSTTGANGFFFRARVGVVDTASVRLFTGLANQTIATMVQADNPAGNHIGFQYSTGRADTNWQFERKDNTTQSVTDTGIAVTASKVYEMTFYCNAQCTTVFWQLDNVTDGTTAQGSVTTNLPTNSTAMRIVHGVDAITTTARNYRMQFLYVEAPR